MAETLGSRFKRHFWNVFSNRDPTENLNQNYSSEGSYYYKPDRVRFTGGNEKSITTSIYNRIAMDAAMIDISHIKLDKDGRFEENINSGLNECLNLEANLDQTALAFKQDIFMSLLNEGCIAIVPTDLSDNPYLTSSYDILSMRTGKILEWQPERVRVLLYNEKKGKKEERWFLKRHIAIVENPLYAVINEKNSTMQRLIKKLNILDAIDEQSGSGKLDLIIQLPYIVKTEPRRQQAEKRLKSIEDQIANSKFGIAYTDGTERITQLNRPVENNLMKQIEYLTSMLYSQLGITQTIMDGSADEKTMLNYYTRTTEPLVKAVVMEMKRKFLTKTARTQLQSIAYFRNPFSLVGIKDITDAADTFTRNEIMTSNEFRQILQMKPSKDPKADQLINSNISQAKNGNVKPAPNATEIISKEGENQNGEV